MLILSVQVGYVTYVVYKSIKLKFRNGALEQRRLDETLDLVGDGARFGAIN